MEHPGLKAQVSILDMCGEMVQGAVLCLAQAAQLLFSGGQDTTIKVWSFDAASQAFQPLVSFLHVHHPNLFAAEQGTSVYPSPCLIALPVLIGIEVIAFACDTLLVRRTT